MIKKYNNFLNESSEYNVWFIFSGKFDGLYLTHFIGKQTIYKSIYSFILPYSNKLYIYQKIKNAWSVTNEKYLKRLSQIKKSNIQNSSERLNKIINVEIFNGDNIDYLDIGNNVGYISYITKNRLGKLNNEDPYNNRYRQQMKIGKFFIKYSIFDINEISKNSIDLISNIYKYITKNILTPNNLEIVEGEDIRYWYDEDNYSDGSGTLNKSCMKKKYLQHKFDLYVNNPDVCKLIILKDKNNKLLGRSLLWKTNKGLFMDRVYTVNDYDLYLFNGYAINNNWMIREHDIDEKLFIQLESDEEYNPGNSPFLDTFKYYFKEKNQLSNYRPYGDYDIFDDWF